jgi:MoaA/NifB/PqqE/SkfB family radical SAM enzyme
MKEENSSKAHLKNFKPSEILKKYGVEVEDNTFCIMPFIHISTTTNGDFRLCCRSRKIQNLDDVSLKELWNHRKYKSVRKNLALGVRDSHCNACWKMEDKGIISLRQSQNFERLSTYTEVIKEWDRTGLVPWNIPIVEFKLSNLCNLKCRMCWPKDSTPWIQDWDSVKHIYEESEKSYIDEIIEKNNLYKKPILNLYEKNNQFIDDLFEIIDDIKEFEFAGGEPLMDPLHFKMLERIKNPNDVILKYSTNLTDLEAKKGRNIVDIWKNFKAIRLTISIDGYDELNSYIRRNSNWQEIKDNIHYVKESLGNKLDYIKASTCVSALNIEFLVETLESISKDFDISWHTSRLQWPSFLHANVLPVYRLKTAKEKLLLKLKETDNLSITIEEMNNRRHLLDSVSWIDECIKNNKSVENFKKFEEFNSILDRTK